jgi:hypothetical protein
MQLIECRFLPRAMRCTWEGSLHPNCVEGRCKSSPIDAKVSYEYLFGLFQKEYSCPNVFEPGRMHSTPSTTCFAPKAVPSSMFVHNSLLPCLLGELSEEEDKKLAVPT